MKIAVVGPAHPYRGGLASYNERLSKEFIMAGDEVQLYTFSLQYPSFIFPGTTQFSSEPAPAGLSITRCINSVNPFNWLIAGNRLRKLKPDILIVRYWLPLMGPCLGTILRLVKKNRHTRIICIADNIIPHEKRFGDKPFTRYFIKPVDAFITMSDKVMADLRLFAPQKPARLVVHPLYDNFGDKIDKQAAREKLKIGAAEKILLFFGFIRKYKGLDILLDAMQILRKQNRNDIKLLVAGEFYEDNRAYQQQISDLGITDMLYLHTDFIPDSEVKYYLCAADAVIQPYRNATQSGVTPLAYHFEIPMIVTNVGGLPALVPDGKVGLVAEPTAASLAQKITEYFDTGENRFLPGLQEEKKKFSWTKMRETILELAQSI